MDAATRVLVRARADDRCEYCRFPQHALEQSLQIEHIVARQHLGGDELSNLALACDHCNWHKGPNLSTIEPESRNLVQLFNPRLDKWQENFEFRGPLIIGISSKGRGTVQLLGMNSESRLQLRATLMALGQW